MQIEVGVWANCSEAVLRLGLGDRQVALAVLRTLGISEVEKPGYLRSDKSKWLLTDGSVDLPDHWDFGMQVYLDPDPERWKQVQKDGEKPDCVVSTSEDPRPVWFPMMKKLQDALGLDWEYEDVKPEAMYRGWLAMGAPPVDKRVEKAVWRLAERSVKERDFCPADVPSAARPEPELPASGWDLALVLPYREPAAARAAWERFATRYIPRWLRKGLKVELMGGGDRACAVVVRGLAGVPFERYRRLDAFVSALEDVFREPARVVPGRGAEKFFCWRRAYRALACERV